MSDLPAQPDSANQEIPAGDLPLMKRLRFWKRVIWVSVFGMIIPVALGGGMTAYKMVETFNKLSTSGAGDAAMLVGGIAEAQQWFRFGMWVSAGFLVLLIVSWVQLRIARVEWEDELVNGHKEAGAVRLQLL